MAYATSAQLIDSNSQPVGTEVNPLIVQNARALGETLYSITGSGSTAGDKIIIAAVAGKRIKVYAFSAFAPTSTTAVTATFQDGIGGASLFTALIQAPNQASFAFGIATSVPTFLFATSAGNGLNMNLSAATLVTANISYWLD
jgi:hypothetical protein